QIDMISTEIDSYLRLENPAGQQVAADDDSGGFLNARIIYRASETGDFKIVCTSFKGGELGKFTLIVRDNTPKTVVAQGDELKLQNGQASCTGQIAADAPKFRNKLHRVFTIRLEEGKTYQFDHVSRAMDAYLYLLG